MTSKERYDPEDLEQLMRERQFDQLLEAEKAYVLRHMSGAEEYEQVRSTLLAVSAAMDAETDIEPDVSIKENLMAQFSAASTAKEEKAGFTYWLNSLGAILLPAEKRFYAKPAYQLAFTAVLVFGFFFLYNNMEQPGDLAMKEEVLEEKNEAKVEDRLTDSITTKSETEIVTIEDLSNEGGDLAENDEEERLFRNEDSEKEMEISAPELAAPAELFKIELAEVEEETDEFLLDDVAQERSADKNQDEDERDRSQLDNKDSEMAKYDIQPTITNDAPTITQNGNAAGNTGYLTISDSVEPRVGNAAELEISNEMLYSQSELEEVQISASKETRKKAKERQEVKAPLKSASMRQYNELIGLLHTSL